MTNSEARYFHGDRYEPRRYEIAREVLAGICSDPEGVVLSASDTARAKWAETAVDMADALLAALAPAPGTQEGT